jgi:hypothetical protein
MTQKRRLLAVGSAALSLLASALVLTAGSAPARAVGDVHYKVNTIEVFSLPPDQTSVGCHDFSGGDPSKAILCPLWQALKQANSLPEPTPVKITVDWAALEKAKPGGPWHIWLPAVENVVAAPMCESGCDDAGDGTGAFYMITKDHLTLDLGGSGVQDGLGILAEDGALELSTIWIGSSNVTVRNVPGLYSMKSAIVIAGSASDVIIENGSTDQSGTDAYHSYDYAKNHTERFVSIMGKAQDVTIRNWQVGQLENHDESHYGGVVFDEASEAKNITIDNVVFQGSPGRSSCSGTGLGCESNPILGRRTRRAQRERGDVARGHDHGLDH